MRVKKITTILLVLTILLAQFAWVNFNNVSYAVNTNIPNTEATQYFGKQLTDVAKKMYDAMVDAYKNGKLEKGEDIDLEGIVNQEQLQAYTEGNQHLLYAMGQARDAFENDYPDAFYIDFSAVSFRVTQDTNKKFHAYIGAGKRDDYFLPGFTAENTSAAVTKYEEKLNEIVNTVKSTTAENVEAEETTLEYKKEAAKVAHDWVTKNMIYRYEYQVKEQDDGTSSNARTAYDCFIYGEGVCESYTRGYKAILDRLGIPCVCVYGAYRVSETQIEEHIWNYVQLDGKWYGVDVTHDDPVIKVKDADITILEKESTKETRQYLLVGSTDLIAHHISTGKISEAEYEPGVEFEFVYPTLEQGPIDGQEFYNAGKFRIRAFGMDYTESADHSGWDTDDSIPTTEVWVSYDDGNYEDNKNKGVYILARFGKTVDTGEQTWTEWGYVTPEVYDGGGILDGERKDGKLVKPYVWPGLKAADGVSDVHYLKFPMPHLEMIQFAVTKIPPKMSQEDVWHNGGLIYQGESSLLTEFTPVVRNEKEVYKAAPHISKATPPQYLKLNFGGTYDIRLEYTEPLEVKEGWSETGEEGTQKVQMRIFEADSAVNGLIDDAVERSTVSGLTLEKNDEGQIIAANFKFVPDVSFSSNEVVYSIAFDGVEGVESHKDPIASSYGVGAACAVCCYRRYGIDYNIFGQPKLLDSDAGDPSKWKTVDTATGEEETGALEGVDPSKLSNRLTLITTTTTDEQNKEMLDKIGDEGVIASETETYDIKFQVCNKILKEIGTGNSLRISLGFPKGTTYEQYLSGEKEFKVFHYKYDEAGNLTGEVEEIEVQVTPQGLILIVDSFSPFTVATLAGKGDAVTTKEVVLSCTEGGKVTHNGTENAAKAIELADDSELKVTVTPDEGKIIESLSIGDKVYSFENKEEERTNCVELTLKGSELEVGTTRIVAKFMSKAVEEKDAEKGEVEVDTPTTEYDFELNTNGENYLKGIFATSNKDMQTTVASLQAKIDRAYEKVEILNKNGEVISSKDALVGTGMKVRITSGESTLETSDDVVTEYTIVVYGDLSGDGKISSTDIRAFNRNKIEIEGEILEGAYLEACDYDRTGNISTQDLREMKISLIN